MRDKSIFSLKNYEFIEHTADMGIKVKGSDLSELFRNAALAMFDIISEKKELKAEKQIEPTRAKAPGSQGRLPLPVRQGILKPPSSPPLRAGFFKRRSIKIKQKADTLEELFVNWLNELLSLSATKELIFSRFQINQIDKNSLEALAIGEDFKHYKVNTEIKAATYHGIKLEENKTGWQAEVIFDV